jgi:hypothetical protein
MFMSDRSTAVRVRLARVGLVIVFSLVALANPASANALRAAPHASASNASMVSVASREAGPATADTIWYTWKLPNGGTQQNITWPQTLVGKGQIASPPCGVTYQIDSYAGNQSLIDAIVADRLLTITHGTPEDSAVVKSWHFAYGGVCVPNIPEVKTTYGTWQDGQFTCGKNEVTTTRTKTVIDSTLVNNKWTDKPPVITTETSSRTLTDVEKATWTSQSINPQGVCYLPPTVAVLSDFSTRVPVAGPAAGYNRAVAVETDWESHEAPDTAPTSAPLTAGIALLLMLGAVGAVRARRHVHDRP